MTPDPHVSVSFLIAYWKKRWIGVPLLPKLQKEFAVEEEIPRFKVTPIDGSVIEPRPCREDKFSDTVEIHQIIDTTTWSDEDLKALCSLNDIPIGWITDRFPAHIHNRQNETHRQKILCHRVLTSAEYRKVQKELMQLNPQAALVVRILWFLNQGIGKGGGFVTLEQLLRLKVRDVSVGPPDDSPCISLFRNGFGSNMIVHYLPSQLWKGVEQQITGRSLFVFATKYGGPILPSQVDKHLRKAGRMAKISFKVSSLALRTRCDEKQAGKYRANTELASRFASVSEEEWHSICVPLLPTQKKRGCKAQHSPRDILNALLWAKRERKPLIQLPDSFPPYSAVESQQRRWLKSGFLVKIWAFCKTRG